MNKACTSLESPFGPAVRRGMKGRDWTLPGWPPGRLVGELLVEDDAYPIHR